MGKPINLTGRKFEKWTVISKDRTEDKKAFWLCRCECGIVRAVAAGNLMSGGSRSCGCSEFKYNKRSLKHGMSRSKEYRAWRAIMNRCENPNVASYPHYGGRGISVCDKWRNSFEAFLEDVGLCPPDKSSIGRKDSNKNYEPGNVHWESIVEQNNNKSDTILITIGSETLCASRWAEKIGLNIRTMYARIYTGWDLVKAVTTPAAPRRWKKDAKIQS